MPRHRLLPENGSSSNVWVLEWSDTLLTLTAPNGVRVIESPIELAHRQFDQHAFFEEEKLRFHLPQGEITFPIRLDAIYDVKVLISNGLKRDPEYRAKLKRRAWCLIPSGLVVSLTGASLFGLYCWWASEAADPVDEQSLHFAARFIRQTLYASLGMAIGGPFLSLFGFAQLRRIKNIEREIEACERHISSQ